MAADTLRDFVADALSKGQSREEIASVLQAAGWPEDQVKDALAGFADIDFPVPVPRPRRFGGAREAFLYIVFFALLGMVALQVGRLSFAFIDHVFADPLASDWRSWRTNGMRWSIASLMVGYPIFLYLGWRLGAARRKNPERRISRVRAWLTYITLIFAALTLIGDLVAVVYNFLGGEVQARFIAKALVVAAISGAILLNFMRDAERTSASVDIGGRILSIVSTLVVIALLLWAFLRVDTPGEARARSFDEQRINNLSEIARQVDCHRTYFGGAPETLEAMSAALEERSARLPVARGCDGATPDDPGTGEPYRYERVDASGFRLCATFARGWPDDDARRTRRPTPAYRYNAGEARRTLSRPQGPGETCFDLEAVDFEADSQDENAAEPTPIDPVQ
ncbi:MAG: DUF5671 domain-containing protein [Pseudomonadota bacterium]